MIKKTTIEQLVREIADDLMVEFLFAGMKENLEKLKEENKISRYKLDKKNRVVTLDIVQPLEEIVIDFIAVRKEDE